MKRHPRKIRGLSYAKRVADINRIYDQHARSGLSNREILRRFIWPRYPISESTFYAIINAAADDRVQQQIATVDRQLTLDFDSEAEDSTP